MFVIVRFFVGGSIHAVWSAFFVLMAEIVPEDSRHSIYIRTVSFWSPTTGTPLLTRFLETLGNRVSRKPRC